MPSPCSDRIDGQEFVRTDPVGCYFCGQTHPARRISVAFGLEAFVAHCSKCRLAYQSPRPSPEASRAYMNWRWAAHDEYVGSREGQLARATAQVNHLAQCVPHSARVLDFGAGAGAFVRAARDLGWNAEGVEQSVTARARAEAFYQVRLIESLPEQTYDVVTLWDVIEHLRDPRGLLTWLGAQLRPGGFLFVETGNFENWRRLAEGDRWSLYLFDHQFYFTPTSLERVLAESGFHQFRLLGEPPTRPARHPRHLLRAPLSSAKAWLAWSMARIRWPNTGDRNLMVAVAQKV